MNTIIIAIALVILVLVIGLPPLIKSVKYEIICFKRRQNAIKNFNLDRFFSAQISNYPIALAEINAGQKQSHWIWYIFPQMRGLGQSEMSEYYGIASRKEAEAYLAQPVLNARLREITEALLTHAGKKTAWEIFGTIDAIKVRSCMTLFDAVCPNDIYAKVLHEFYDDARCEKTLQMISQ